VTSNPYPSKFVLLLRYTPFSLLEDVGIAYHWYPVRHEQCSVGVDRIAGFSANRELDE